MNLLRTASLAATVTAVDAALFRGETIPTAERRATARWIAARQGGEGSYAGMFAPTARDWAGIVVLTGERLVTRAGLSHVLGEESCRVLRLIAMGEPTAVDAVDRANAGMLEALHRHAGADRGFYCCAPCSVAVWRHLAAGGLDAGAARLEHAMDTLAQHRRGDGSWRGFPFYYTLLALSEIAGDLPLRELRYAAPRCERLLRRKSTAARVDQRRRLLLQRVIERAA